MHHDLYMHVYWYATLQGDDRVTMHCTHTSEILITVMVYIVRVWLCVYVYVCEKKSVQAFSVVFDIQPGHCCSVAHSTPPNKVAS